MDRTNSKNDTPTARGRSQDVRGELDALRLKHGATSAIGHRCSNIAELLRLPKPPADLLKRQMTGLQRAWDQLN